MSGSDVTASTPRATPAAAMVTAVAYPSARMISSCSRPDRPPCFTGYRRRHRPSYLISVLGGSGRRGGQPAQYHSQQGRHLTWMDPRAALTRKRRVAWIQQRLSVERDCITLVDLLAAGRADRGRSMNRTGLTPTKHQKLRASRRRCSQQALSATEVRSDYLTLPLAICSWPPAADLAAASTPRRWSSASRAQGGVRRLRHAPAPLAHSSSQGYTDYSSNKRG
jgi:hypothetical protein